MSATADVSIEELEERLGLWCEHCALPSRCEWDFALKLGSELRFMTYAFCPGCEREEKTGFPE